MDKPKIARKWRKHLLSVTYPGITKQTDDDCIISTFFEDTSERSSLMKWLAFELRYIDNKEVSMETIVDAFCKYGMMDEEMKTIFLHVCHSAIVAKGSYKEQAEIWRTLFAVLRFSKFDNNSESLEIEEICNEIRKQADDDCIQVLAKSFQYYEEFSSNIQKLKDGRKKFDEINKSLEMAGTSEEANDYKYTEKLNRSELNKPPDVTPEVPNSNESLRASEELLNSKDSELKPITSERSPKDGNVNRAERIEFSINCDKEENLVGSMPEKLFEETNISNSNIKLHQGISTAKNKSKDGPKYINYDRKRINIDKLPVVYIPKGAPDSLDSYGPEDTIVKVKTIKRDKTAAEVQELREAQSLLDNIGDVLQKNMDTKNKKTENSNESLHSLNKTLDRYTKILANEKNNTPATELQNIEPDHFSSQTMDNIHGLYHNKHQRNKDMEEHVSSNLKS